MQEKNVGYPKKVKHVGESLPPTLPSAGIEFYEQRLAERLAFSAVAKANYSKYLSWISLNDPSSKIDFTPVGGVICPSSRCNFRCTMCAISDFEDGKRCEDMSLELFQKRLDDLSGLVRISLTGLSELFLLHQTLEPMLRLCLERKIWTNIATNGSLLHQRNWIDRLVDINLDEIVVSIDGVTKGVFESIRVNSNFERVRENAKNLNEKFDRAGVFPHRTKMHTVLQAKNLHELFDFIPFASELGFRSISFGTEAFDWGSSSWRNKNSQDAQIISYENVENLVNQGLQYGVNVGFVEITHRYTAEPKVSSLCSWPYSKIFISSDDRVVPCCHISNPDYFEIGNGLSDTITATDSWFSKDYQDFRDLHTTGNVPDACSSCYKSKQ